MAIPGAGTEGRGPSGRLLKVGGAPLHVREAGSGVPVVFLHGASGNLLDWFAGGAPALALPGLRVIAFDRPGLGYSALIPGHEDIRTQAAHLDAGLAALGVERAVLVGHSFGGAVALAWAHQAPERIAGLLLLAAPSQVWEGRVGRMYDLLNAPVLGDIVARAARHVVSAAQIARTVEDAFAPDPAPEGYAEAIEARLMLRPDSLSANAAQVGALKSALRELAPRWADLPMPLSQIHGTADTTVGLSIHSEKLALQRPGSPLVRLEGVGHMLHHVRPDALAHALERLIDASGLRAG
ncbi:MAG: alpha/beta hydrolase [Rhodobacteraceae bacterium]|nr:alpha/beta hydrolase [Paracoccaceae bacterium]